jgi:hypothetical protein
LNHNYRGAKGSLFAAQQIAANMIVRKLESYFAYDTAKTVELSSYRLIDFSMIFARLSERMNDAPSQEA